MQIPVSYQSEKLLLDMEINLILQEHLHVVLQPQNINTDLFLKKIELKENLLDYQEINLQINLILFHNYIKFQVQET